MHHTHLSMHGAQFATQSSCCVQFGTTLPSGLLIKNVSQATPLLKGEGNVITVGESGLPPVHPAERLSGSWHRRRNIALARQHYLLSQAAESVTVKGLPSKTLWMAEELCWRPERFVEENVALPGGTPVLILSKQSLRGGTSGDFVQGLQVHVQSNPSPAS